MKNLPRHLLRSIGSLLVAAERVAAFAFAATLAGLAPVSGAWALDSKPVSLAEMVQAADVIVIGRATEAQSLRVGRSMVTRYRIQVEEDMLGAGSSELSVVVPGGVDLSGPHPLAFTVVDAPVLQRDAPMALLLQRDSSLGAQDHRIVGFNQGLIALAAPADADTGGTGTASVARQQRVRTRLQALIAARASAQPATPGVPGRGTIILGR